VRASLRIQLAIQMARSYELRKDVGRDGGEDRAAGVIRWREDVFVRGDTTLARKVNGAGRTEVRAAHIGASPGCSTAARFRLALPQ
jgi:hypothetical protein